MLPYSNAEQTGSPPQEVLGIYLLGEPRVEIGNAYLEVPRRQVRALLYWLADQTEPVSRQQLSFLFWADKPDSQTRRSLARLLTHLRRALRHPDLLLKPGDRVGLSSDHVFSDAVAFRRLCGRYRDMETLQRCADFYRGPFLDGFSLPGSPECEAWVLEQQRMYERLYLEALTGLIEQHTARQAYKEAITWARRYLAIDELAEDVHRRLITLYGATLDRTAAQRQFERCVAVLDRELGVRPLPETRAAYEVLSTVGIQAGRRRPATSLGPPFPVSTCPWWDVRRSATAWRRPSPAHKPAAVR